MSKKKPQAESNELQRDENGYGVLPAFRDFAMKVPPEGLAPGATFNDQELAIVEIVADESAQALAASWVEGGTDFSDWNPVAPEGEGWTLAGVLPGDDGPWALWMRPAKEKMPEGRAYAEEFLLGSLIKAATKHLKTLAKPWGEMSEAEQRRALAYVHTDCRTAVRDAIDIIAGNARQTFTAAVDQVVFKDGVKAVLTLAKTPEAHSLADAEGSYVTIVIEERSKLLQEGDALDAQPDQKPLFDQSSNTTEDEREAA